MVGNDVCGGGSDMSDTLGRGVEEEPQSFLSGLRAAFKPRLHAVLSAPEEVADEQTQLCVIWHTAELTSWQLCINQRSVGGKHDIKCKADVKLPAVPPWDLHSADKVDAPCVLRQLRRRRDFLYSNPDSCAEYFTKKRTILSKTF